MGLWLGLAAVGLAVGAGIGAFQIQFAAPSAVVVGRLLLQLFVVFCFEAFPEELALRGYVLTNLADWVSRWLAVLGQAVLFVLWAFAIASVLPLFGLGAGWSIGTGRLVMFFAIGVTMALVRLWTGSLWGSIGYHLTYQSIVQSIAGGHFIVIDIADGADVQNMNIILWLVTIVGAGVLAALALHRKARRHRGHKQR